MTLSLTPSPYASPWVGVSFECQLAFPKAMLVPDGDGVVSADPTLASFTSRHPDDEISGCATRKAAWDAGDADARHAILGELRIVQHSYWNFDSATPIVLDGIRLVGAKTTAEGYLGL